MLKRKGYVHSFNSSVSANYILLKYPKPHRLNKKCKS